MPTSRHRRTPLLALLMALALAAAGAPAQTHAQTDQRCFAETRLCIEGRIRQFWERNGGLTVFGLPITEQRAEEIEGRSVQVQWFERNRLELHPENRAPFDVLLGRLGADRLAQAGRDWFQFPKDAEDRACRRFAETGHHVCGPILRAWQASGLDLDGRRGVALAESLALFGLPLSGLVTETLSDGKQYQVQWFERARFELHPENPAPYNVLLGLLGSEVRAGAQPAQPPAQPAAPAPAQPAPAACGAVPAPYSGTISAACVRGGDKLTLVAQGMQPGEFVTPRLAAPDGKRYELQVIYGDPAVRADGSYQLVGAMPAWVPAGTYTLTLRGRKSGLESTFPFGIESGPPSGKDESALPPSVGTIYPIPDTLRRGEGFVIFNTEGGLPPKQTTAVWATRPDGQVFGSRYTFKTNERGGVPSTVQFYTDKTDPYGVYATTFEVVEGGQTVTTYFRIVYEE